MVLVALATELRRQLDDVCGEETLIWPACRYIALSRTMLAERAAGAALGYAERLPHVPAWRDR